MSCQEFWSRPLSVSGDEFEADGAAQAHLHGCAACRAHMARQRELGAALRRLAENFGSLRAPSQVEARLLKAFRAQHGAPARAERRVWRLPLAWAAAAAMVVLGALSIAIVRQPAALSSRVAATEASAAELLAGTVDAGLVAAGFIPLPNGEGIGPNDSFNLVRVEVPRSAMLTVGIPVNAERASETVQADVLLGADGLARAVRFSD
jgi:hypothetical protein